MVKPSLAKLMEKENVNRYALVVATAKCAREITDEYVRQREYVEKNGGKDADKSAASVINQKYRDEKAVQNAIEEIYNEEYRIIKDSLPEGMGRDHVRPEPEVEAEAEAEAEVEVEAEAEAEAEAEVEVVDEAEAEETAEEAEASDEEHAEEA